MFKIKNTAIAIVILSSLLMSCTALNKKDRESLDKIRATAEAANLMSRQALYLAEDSADKANKAAEKADRVFKQSQKK